MLRASAPCAVCRRCLIGAKRACSRENTAAGPSNFWMPRLTAADAPRTVFLNDMPGLERRAGPEGQARPQVTGARVCLIDAQDPASSSRPIAEAESR